MTAFSVSIGAAGGYGDVALGADIGPGMELVATAQQVAQAHQGGVPEVARLMKASANTLQHKLNPANTTHHLTLQEALLLQLVTGNVAVLQAMAKQLGYTVQRATPDQSGGDPVEAFMHFQAQVGDFTRAAADALLDGEAVTANAQRRVEFRGQELLAAVAHLVSTTAAMVPKREG
ncbi:MAG: hypothetical protein LBJ15_00765 [Comamonas sp.]|jgi:hypothetical protein|uniref:phage regulatory CII family protein n=1 Tax=Comamonas sp. TaxID=34028 RepID=UPI002825E239|nr:phage regulatory CII family protein [Comamonas sp.]MDR0212518.1 hypothetical protein [Comamonas sp.]